jgi:hypothetical protein
MFRPCLFVLASCAVIVTFSERVIADEPHEVWLKAIEGTWTWDDDERGKVTVTFKPRAEGKCVVGTGKDANGSFVTIIGWEAWSKSLTDTGFHSSGGCGRIVYDQITETTLKGVSKGAGPGGEPQPEAKFHVVRDGNTVTVTATDANGETTRSVLTKVVNK